jgi:thiosulfate/3-mercaptopyruvate sulfurtransferase
MIRKFLIWTISSALVVAFTHQRVSAADDELSKALITPTALTRLLQSNQGSKLLILNVGPRVLYQQARVRGAEFIGPTSDPRGIERLRERVKHVSKTKQIVIYCGCCPWERCPNIKPAFQELKKLGFKNVKALYIANNIGTDWVDPGHPTDRGM